MGCTQQRTRSAMSTNRPADTDLRVDDTARRDAADVLGVHMAAGRLTMTEYESRLDQVFAAVRESELRAATGDLPPVTTAASRARRRAAARSMVAGWLALCALFLGIWALTGAGYFWPVWPMMGTAIGTLPGAWAVWQGSAAPPDAGASA